MSAAALRLKTRYVLGMSWRLTVLGALFLAVGYSSLPETIPVYRFPGAEPVLGAKSLVSVGRIAVMGVGQLGAATAMTFAAAGSEGWERFWKWAALAAGTKTLFECITLLLPRSMDVLSVTLSAAPVVLFLVAAFGWWRRGALKSPPRLEGSSRIWLGVSLVVWAVAAVAPGLMA